MLKLNTEKEYADFLDEARAAYSDKGKHVGYRMAEHLLFYLGVQWVYHDPRAASGLGWARLLNKYHPDSADLRVTVDRVARFIQKIASQTYPHMLQAEVRPLDGRLGIDAVVQATALEQLTGIAIKQSGLLKCMRRANFRRCITGSHLIGLHIEKCKTPMVDPDTGEERLVDDQKVKAFHADPSKLILDPFNESPDLDDHEYVIYADVMTKEKIERNYGVRLDRKNLKPIGELARTYLNINRLSGNRIFGEYRTHSKSLGAIIYTVWHKDETGRFGRMGVLMEHAGDEKNTRRVRLLNAGNTQSPFGGNGLGIIKIDGHDKPGDAFGLGDVAMLVDDQKRINLLQTTMFRHIVRMSGSKIVMDRRAIDDESPTARTEIEEAVSNRIGGVLWINSGTHREQQPIIPPQVMNMPTPPAFYMDAASLYEAEMQEQIHRSDANFGRTKSHVPDGSFQKALEEADQVGSTRIRDDIEKYQQLLTTLTGTFIRLVKAGSPSALMWMRESGFEIDDVRQVLATDPVYMGVEVLLRENTVRHRPFERRDQELRDARDSQAITPFRYRMARALDLDAAITDDDDAFARAIPKIVDRVILGVEPFYPLPIGEYGEEMLLRLRRAAIDPRVRSDPETLARVVDAIGQQMQVMTQEAIAGNPELLMQQMQGQQASAPAPDTVTTIGAELARFGSGNSAPALSAAG